MKQHSTVRLAAPEPFRRSQGAGELWIDARGLPLMLAGDSYESGVQDGE